MTLGIRARFSLFILGSVMVILTSTMLSTLFVTRRFAIDDARDFSLTILDETNTKITTFVTDIEHVARSLAEYRVVRSLDTDEFRDLFLSQVLPRRRYIRAVYLGTAGGEMYEYGHGPGFTDYEPQLPEDYDPRNRPWYRAALEAGDFTVSDPYVYASYPILGITGALPVTAPRGGAGDVGNNAPGISDEIIGVVGIDILLDDLRNVLIDLQIPKNGRAFLLDDSGRVIAGADAASEGSATGGAATGEDHLRLAEFDRTLFERIKDAPTGSFMATYRGELMVLSHTVNPATGWYLLLALPYEAIMRPANSVLRFMAVLDLVLIVVLLVTIRFLSGKLVLRPIEEIVNIVNRIHAGDRDARVDLPRDDEIGVLAREFNDLLSAVDSYTADIERQVSERTQEVRELERENSRLRVMEERERIYRDLHDSLGAQLTNISICASVARNARGVDDDRTEEMIGRIDTNAQAAIEGLRETILGEPDFTSLTAVVDRIEQTAERRLSLKQITLDFSHSVADRYRDREAAPEVCETLYRVSEELIANIQKHSHASHVAFSIEADDVIRLVCRDNGVGFDTTAATHGFGLENIRRRVGRLGGTAVIESSTNGTEVVCTMPRSAE